MLNFGLSSLSLQKDLIKGMNPATFLTANSLDAGMQGLNLALMKFHKILFPSWPISLLASLIMTFNPYDHY